jgi:hypothetical protein
MSKQEQFVLRRSIAKEMYDMQMKRIDLDNLKDTRCKSGITDTDGTFHPAPYYTTYYKPLEDVNTQILEFKVKRCQIILDHLHAQLFDLIAKEPKSE